MATKNDVLIFDEEIRYAADRITEYCKFLDEKTAGINECITEIITNEIIVDREIAGGLQRISQELEKQRGFVSTIASDAPGTLRSFMDEIDKADSFLY